MLYAGQSQQKCLELSSSHHTTCLPAALSTLLIEIKAAYQWVGDAGGRNARYHIENGQEALCRSVHLLLIFSSA